MRILKTLVDWLTADEFSRMPTRVCGACGGDARCTQISSTNGATAFTYTCTQCSRHFTVSSVVSLVLYIVLIGLGVSTFVLALLVPMPGQTLSPWWSLAGLIFLAAWTVFVAHRIRTARANPIRKTLT